MTRSKSESTERDNVISLGRWKRSNVSPRQVFSLSTSTDVIDDEIVRGAGRLAGSFLLGNSDFSDLIKMVATGYNKASLGERRVPVPIRLEGKEMVDLNENEKLYQKISDLEKTVSELMEQNRLLSENSQPKDVKKDYKDRLFKFIFGNAENKAWTLSLYNAINGTNYSNPEDIQFNTIGDAVYLRMKNDVSFIVAFEMNLWEHQSTFNPNMPMRFFIYGGRLYEKYIESSDYYQYSSSLQPIPRPVCLCFYNGMKEQPESETLRLSDAYESEGDIEVKVTMLNINYGKNQQLMDACEPLKEYAWLVDAVRQHQNEKMDLDAAVDAALEDMPNENVIKKFLLENRAEVKNMFLSEYNEEKVMEKERLEGAKQKEAEVRNQVATDLIKEGGLSASFIARISKLSEEAVQKLAKSMGMAVL